MAKFEVGEVCLVCDYRTRRDWRECEIKHVPTGKRWNAGGFWVAGAEYVILVPSNVPPPPYPFWVCCESDLRKLPRKGLPDSVLEVFRLRQSNPDEVAV